MMIFWAPDGTTSASASHCVRDVVSGDVSIATESRPRRVAPAICAILLITCFAFPVQASPEKAIRFYEDGLRKFERNEFSAAVIQLKNAVQNDSRMLSARVLLGKALLKSGDLRGADAAFEEAIKHGLDRSDIALPLAQLYLGLGRPDLVIESIPASRLPRSVRGEVLSLRGTAYAELGKTRLAKEAFQEARAADPDSPAPFIAEIAFLLAERQYAQAKTLAAKAIELAPKNEHVWNMHAAVLHAMADLPEALEAYNRALAIEPRHVDARLARSALLIDLARDSAAAKDLEILKQSAPGEPRAAYMRAVIASRKGDNSATAAALGEVVKLIDALAPAWLAKREQLLMLGALANHGLGHPEKARGYLNHILARNERHLGARKLLASICIDQKDYVRAFSELQALQKMAPDDPQVLFMLGSVHLVNRRYAQASELLEKAATRTGLPEMNRMLGLSQLELGQTDLGLATLEKVFAAQPGDAQAGTALALLYMRRGQPQKAMQIAEAVVKRDPGNLTAVNFLGIIKGGVGDYAGARSMYTQVLSKDPNFGAAALNLARLDMSEGRFDEARRRLMSMLEKQHDAVDALLALGLLDEQTGNIDAAVRHLRRGTELQRRDPRPGIALIELLLRQQQLEQAQAAATELSSKYPKNVAVQLALGSSHTASADASSAAAVFQNASRLAGFDPDMQVRIARLQLAAGDREGAYQSVQRALQGRPADVAALALTVEIERQRGGVSRADAALKVLTTSHPNAPETALAVADLALAVGRYPEAVAAYRTALSRQETTTNAVKVARALLSSGEGNKAAAFLDEWASKRPHDLQALQAMAEMQFRIGQLAAARKNYEGVLAAAPNDAATLNNYANLLQRLGDPAAQIYAEKAVKLMPKNPDYADTLGWILARKGDIGPALHYLREARLRSPGNGQIRFHLAFALSRASRTAEAREELTAALNAPLRPESSEELLRLKKQLGV